MNKVNPDNLCFSNIESLNDYILEKEDGHILIGYSNMIDYPGMVLGKGIIFNTQKSKYELDLEWISFGLDLFGENLLENYLYKFESLIELLEYLKSKYSTLVTDIPLKYNIDQSLFPNPQKDADQKPLFEEAWSRFQTDFKNEDFLDTSLELVYSSNEADES